MSSIQYLVQAHTKLSFEMDWSKLFVRAIESVASRNLIDQLCQPHTCIEITHSIDVTPTITAFSKTTVTHMISQVSSTAPQFTATLQEQTLFSNVLGLSMHPLTFFLILCLFSAFSTFGFLGVRMHEARSNRMAIQAIRVVAAVAEAELQLDKAEALARETQLSNEISSYKNALHRANITQHDHDDCNTRIQDLTIQLSASINKVEELQRENAKLIIQNHDIISDHTASQQCLLNKLATAESEIRELKQKGARSLSGYKRDIETIKSESLRHSRDDVARIEAEKGTLVVEHAKSINHLKQELVDATAEVNKLKEEIDRLEKNNSNADFEQAELSIKIRDLGEQKQTLISRNTELEQALNQDITQAAADIARLKAEKDALIAQHASSQQKINEKLVSAAANVTQLQHEKDTFAKTITAKEREIVFLQAAKRVHDDDAKNFAQGHRDIKYREKKIQDQLATLRASNSALQDQIKQKDADLAPTHQALADKTSALVITQMNYDFINGRYEEAKKTIEQLRSNKSNITNAVLMQVAKDLNVTSRHIELIDCPKKRIMTSKAISARVRAADKMLSLGANRFNLTNGVEKERRHSVSGGETRLQIGETIPERSSHLMTPLENDYLGIKAASSVSSAAPPNTFHFQDVKRCLRMGGIPYAAKDVKYLMYDKAISPTDTLLLPKVSANQIMVFHTHIELRDAHAAFWANKTHFDVAALFHHKVKDMGKKAAALQDAALAGLTKKYDNRLTALYNQLNKFRQSGNIQSSVLNSALDGNQGLRSIISKAAKDSREC